jgi:hypothetical protein
VLRFLPVARYPGQGGRVAVVLAVDISSYSTGEASASVRILSRFFFFALTVTGGLPTGSVDGDNATVPFLVFLALVLFSCATVLYSTVIYTTMFPRIERANAVCELNISQKNIKKGTTYASMETEGLLLISEMINVV